MEPLRAFEPMVSFHRVAQLQWDWLTRATLSVRVMPGPGANISTAAVGPAHPAGPVPPGLMFNPANVVGIAWPYLDVEADMFDGQCQRAGIEANRLRQTYLPAVPPPGAPGFTGFTLRDLRSIAKAFSEPSIYAIRD